jgi:hypothetical protein
MSTPPTFDDLKRQFQEKLAAYDILLERSIRINDTGKIPSLQARNREIDRILEQMMNMERPNRQDIPEEREKLVSTLSRIQRDYAGLKEKTDDFTLLRRIREAESGLPRREMILYIGLFLVTCLGILVMIFFGSQKKLPTATSAITPASTAPLI